MSIEEFKQAYPEYSHLKGDALWDMMTEVMSIEQSKVDTVFGLNDFTGYTSYTDGEGHQWEIDNRCLKFFEPAPTESPTESYKMVIWDANKFKEK